MNLEAAAVVNGAGDGRADGQRAGAIFVDPPERAGQAGRGGVQDDVAFGVELEAVGAGRSDQTGNRQGAAGTGSDGGVPRHRNRAGVGIVAGDAFQLPTEVDARLQKVGRSLQHERVADGHATGQLERGADDTEAGRDGDGTGAGGRREGRVVDQDRALIDADGAAPARIGGIEHQGAGIVLRKGGGRAGTGIKIERCVQFERRTIRHLDDASTGRSVETDDRAAVNAGGRPESGATGLRIKGDDRSSKRRDGVDREDALIDDDRRTDRIRNVRKDQGARAGLDEAAGGGDGTGELKALGQVREGSVGDAVDGAGRDGQRTGVFQAVTVVVGEYEASTEVGDARRGDDLMGSLRQRQGAARSADRDHRHDARIEDHAAQRHRLRGGGSITVMEEGDGIGVAQGGGIEVARVTLGVEDQRTGAADAEARDRSDVRDLTEQGHRQIGAVDRDRRRAGGDPRHAAIERERTVRAARAVEGRRSRPGEDVAGLAIIVIDQQARSGRHGDRAGAERPGDTAATL